MIKTEKVYRVKARVGYRGIFFIPMWATTYAFIFAKSKAEALCQAELYARTMEFEALFDISSPIRYVKVIGVCED